MDMYKAGCMQVFHLNEKMWKCTRQ